MQLPIWMNGKMIGISMTKKIGKSKYISDIGRAYLNHHLKYLDTKEFHDYILNSNTTKERKTEIENNLRKRVRISKRKDKIKKLNQVINKKDDKILYNNISWFNKIKKICQNILKMK